MVELILASQSPRRQDLLRLIRGGFLARGADIDENREPEEDPQDYVSRLAFEKACQTAETLDLAAGQEIWIVAADTTVVQDGVILGKPADQQQAFWMLQKLQGRSHQVMSSVVLLSLPEPSRNQRTVTSEVPIRPLSDKEIESYVATGDPMDKAGGYGIQNADFNLAPDFRGCFANVMGLPLCHLLLMLEESGLDAPPDLPNRCQQELSYHCPIYREILSTGNYVSQQE